MNNTTQCADMVTMAEIPLDWCLFTSEKQLVSNSNKRNEKLVKMFKYEHCFNWCPGYKGTYDEWVVFSTPSFGKSGENAEMQLRKFCVKGQRNIM